MKTKPKVSTGAEAIASWQHQTKKAVKIDIDHLARLANLPLTEEEKKTFQEQLEEVLQYISKLNEVDTEKVEPIGHITGLVNVARKDEAKPSMNQDEALKNAPKIHNGFFEVDAIFEE